MNARYLFEKTGDGSLSCNSAGGDEAKQRANVEQALDTIRAFLLGLNEVAPY